MAKSQHFPPKEAFKWHKIFKSQLFFQKGGLNGTRNNFYACYLNYGVVFHSQVGD